MSPPRALEAFNDFGMSEAGETDQEQGMYYHTIFKYQLHWIKKLERVGKQPPPPSTVYRDDPALVGKLATFTNKGAELVRLGLLNILKSTISTTPQRPLCAPWAPPPTTTTTGTLPANMGQGSLQEGPNAL